MFNHCPALTVCSLAKDEQISRDLLSEDAMISRVVFSEAMFAVFGAPVAVQLLTLTHKE